MNKVEKIDESQLRANPFSFTLELQVTEVIQSGEFEKVQDEELTEGVILNKSYMAERTQSTKIYYCEDCRHRVFELSDKAQRLFLYILYSLKRGKDWIQINKENYKSKNGIKSDTTVNEAIKELVTNSFIQPTVVFKTAYWINPLYFFSGNRLKKYANNVKVKASLLERDGKLTTY